MYKKFKIDLFIVISIGILLFYTGWDMINNHNGKVEIKNEYCKSIGFEKFEYNLQGDEICVRRTSFDNITGQYVEEYAELKVE